MKAGKRGRRVTHRTIRKGHTQEEGEIREVGRISSNLEHFHLRVAAWSWARGESPRHEMDAPSRVHVE